VSFHLDDVGQMAAVEIDMGDLVPMLDRAGAGYQDARVAIGDQVPRVCLFAHRRRRGAECTHRLHG
jgi:hypothetical protein